MKKTNHSFIVVESDVRGKQPVIYGTGIRVLDIVIEYQYKGYSIDQIIDYHPHLKLEQVYDALSYYFENQTIIDKKIKQKRRQIQQLKEKILKQNTIV